MSLRRRRGARPVAGLLAGAIGLLLTAVACTSAEGSGGRDPGLRSIAKREPAYPIAGRTLDGEHLKLSDWRGSPVVINVWGAWCAPCKREQPELVRAAKELAPLGVRFVGIDIKDRREAARAHVRRFGVPYPSWFDPNEKLVAALGVVVTYPPTTVLIDKQGRIAAEIFGSTTSEELTSLAGQLAAEDA